MSDQGFVVLHGSSSDLVWFLDEIQRQGSDIRILEVRPHAISAQHGDVWLTILIGLTTGVASNLATDKLKAFVADFNAKRSYRTGTTITVVEERPPDLKAYESWGSE